MKQYANKTAGRGAKRLRLAALAMLAMLLSGGCAVFKNDETVDGTVEEMYAVARENMDENNWLTAIDALEKLEAKYPYGAHAEQAKLDTAYARYRNGERGLAVAAAERFIKEHPTHAHVDYAYYIKGLAHYQQNDSTFGRLIGRDDLSDRDANITRDALNAFTDVHTLFPKSRYAPDSRARARRLTEALARHEIIVAAYYFSRNAHVAVVNRAKGVVEEYAHTAAVEEALALMIFAYQAMNMAELSQSAQEVLRLNFPQSVYIGDAGRAALRAALKKIAPFAAYEAESADKRPSLLQRIFD